MDCTPNVVSKRCFLSILVLRKGPGKFLTGVLESPGKVLDFFQWKSGNPGCWETWNNLFVCGGGDYRMLSIVDVTYCKTFDTHCWHMGTAIKHPVPYRVKPSFVIFDIRALWRSALGARVPAFKKITNDGLTGSGIGCIAVPICQQRASKV